MLIIFFLVAVHHLVCLSTRVTQFSGAESVAGINVAASLADQRAAETDSPATFTKLRSEPRCLSLQLHVPKILYG